MKRFKNDAREAQQAGKQVVIVAASPEAAEGIIENEELDDVKDVYVTILSGPAAKQWSQVPLTLGAYDFSVKNDITTKLLASKELIKGLVTAK